ncbi:MAG: bifunctional N(6)-L-threonylcarbamoyladenine synthase/serine/threonine protein kinase [Candidatus Lokiarchaeota archaeon]|nr:bifunctional N(6)-L-threonylcarbamoyladenine synthase/serine/threonine protein kinase [Candidatus Lokiarchaeota archaeon]
MSDLPIDFDKGSLTDKYCLGMESTAHTFGVGILDFTGNILSIVNDTFIPEKGGLHPRKVVEHHNSVFLRVIKEALKKANLNASDLDLIAFSQGPGLGPCLRIGAGIARTLALKLKIPLIGVNHCVSHVEIGRRISGLKDPLTLYVSGGNTIVSAFQTGRYRVFGETLDLAVGNMIDMVARELGLPHPGGPKIERLAKNSDKYLELPYVVKGMDLSFSGIFTECKKLVHSDKFNKDYTAEDIANSLQETAFAMLTEVTERALSHTEKNQVLLTGGVAANKKLQQMIGYIAKEHESEFHVVPLKLAGDNGAMIGWTGVLHYLNKGGMTAEQTLVDPKWRMDEVYTPWRFDSPKFTGLEYGSMKTNGRSHLNIKDIVDLDKYDVIRKGAEAALIGSDFLGSDVLIKHRIQKRYRIEPIDTAIRNQRTLNEARTLIRVKNHNVPVPLVYEIDLQNSSFTMDYIKGKRLKDVLKDLTEEELKSAFDLIGRYVARLHKNHEIHGDLTTSNIIFTPRKNMFLIDFGLSFNSSSIEDKTVDLHLFKRVLTSTHGEYFTEVFPAFLSGYKDEYTTDDKDLARIIIKGIEDVESRGRYIKKDKRKRGIIKK